MKDTKIIANYLPQFHCIPQNDLWWGKGYTDWVAVRNCKPLYNGHNQPRVPLNDNYYQLDNKDIIQQQANLARKYGVYGFGIYHYWFSSSLKLLEKPAELLLSSIDIDINFMFIWDNSTWKRTWSNVKNSNDWAPVIDANLSPDSTPNGILAELNYGTEEEWFVHFNYLLPFFKDRRYIKIDNRPVFSFFNLGNQHEIIKNMCNKWDMWARSEGFNGVYFVSAKSSGPIELETCFVYTPFGKGSMNKAEVIETKIKDKFCRYLNIPNKYSYDDLWNRIITNARKDKSPNVFYGAFVGYDDTPRRGLNGKIVVGQTPQKFEKYLCELLSISRIRDKEFLFITAWNEWGEGAYLEPDNVSKFAYLEALKNAISYSGQ